MSHTIGALYKEGAALLEAAGVGEAAYDARALLAHVLGCEPNDVLLRARDAADPQDGHIFDHLIELRAGRMPLKYVTRLAYFGGLELRSDDRALIPRPETVMLVDAVLERLPEVRMRPDEVLADVGCGTGAIGLTLASRAPNLHVVMSDISPAAVELAAENSRLLGLEDRVSLLVGSYLEPLLTDEWRTRFAVLVCNPPYVRPREISMLPPEIHAEPIVAIASPTADGLDGYRILATQVGHFPNLRLIAFEVGFAQEEDVKALFVHLGDVEILADFQGIERMVIVHVDSPAE